MTPELEKPTDLIRKYHNDPETRESIIEGRRKLFRELGFSDDFLQRMEDRKETLYIQETVQNKIESLRQRGFSDTVKMITTFPAVLSYGFDNIDSKIEGLKQRGFSDPVKMVTTYHAVINYNFDNIDKKIEGLKQRGFSDPVKMITTLPSILGYSFDNIDKKLNMLKNLIQHYNLNLDVIEVIEKFPMFFCYKVDKLWATARVACETVKNPSEVTESKIPQLLTANLENLILAVRSKENMGLNEVLTKAQKIKKQKLSKKEKRERIAALLDDDMLKKRYFRGYPIETN